MDKSRLFSKPTATYCRYCCLQWNFCTPPLLLLTHKRKSTQNGNPARRINTFSRTPEGPRGQPPAAHADGRPHPRGTQSSQRQRGRLHLGTTPTPAATRKPLGRDTQPPQTPPSAVGGRAKPPDEAIAVPVLGRTMQHQGACAAESAAWRRHGRASSLPRRLGGGCLGIPAGGAAFFAVGPDAFETHLLEVPLEPGDLGVFLSSAQLSYVCACVFVRAVCIICITSKPCSSQASTGEGVTGETVCGSVNTRGSRREKYSTTNRQKPDAHSTRKEAQVGHPASPERLR